MSQVEKWGDKPKQEPKKNEEPGLPAQDRTKSVPVDLTNPDLDLEGIYRRQLASILKEKNLYETYKNDPTACIRAAKEVNNYRPRGLFSDNPYSENDDNIIVLARNNAGSANLLKTYFIRDTMPLLEKEKFPNTYIFFLFESEFLDVSNENHVNILKKAIKQNSLEVLEWAIENRDLRIIKILVEMGIHKKHPSETLDFMNRRFNDDELVVPSIIKEDKKWIEPMQKMFKESAYRTATQKPWVFIKNGYDPMNPFDYDQVLEKSEYGKNIFRIAAKADPMSAIIAIERYLKEVKKMSETERFKQLKNWKIKNSKKFTNKVIMEIFSDSGAVLACMPEEVVPQDLLNEYKEAKKKYTDMEEYKRRDINKKISEKSTTAIRALLVNFLNNEGTAFSHKIEDVITNNRFIEFVLEHQGEMSWVNALSVATKVERRLMEDNITPENVDVKIIAEEIYERIMSKKDRELLGGDTKLIILSHEGELYNNNVTADKTHYEHGGKKENLISSENGINYIPTETIRSKCIEKLGKSKEDYLNKLLEKYSTQNLPKIMTLYAIAVSEGPTTFFFAGHSSGSFLTLGTDIDSHSNFLPQAVINSSELGDALIARGDMEEMNLIISACFGYNFFKELFQYLEKKGTKERPGIGISASNESKFSYDSLMHKEINSWLLKGMMAYSEPGKPITVKNFLDGEGIGINLQDPEIFVNGKD